MIDAVIHIGFAKCGSSALQSALSSNPVIALENARYDKVIFVAVMQDGTVLHGDVLKSMAAASPFSYVNSCGLYSDAAMKHCAAIKETLESLSNHGANLLVFSCEGFNGKIDAARPQSMFDRLGLRRSIVCYVRNPVEWMNSAWWQWGAWGDTDLDHYVKAVTSGNLARWADRLEAWQRYAGKENLRVRLLPKDIVADFFEQIGVPEQSERPNRTNSSLPAEVVRFFQRHSILRPSPHQPKMDFILSEVLMAGTHYTKTPWVLRPEHIASILRQTRRSSLKLLDFLDPAEKALCSNDAKWWDAKAFEARRAAPEADASLLNDQTLDAMLLDAYRAIEQLYAENTRLKRKCFHVDAVTDRLRDLAIEQERTQKMTMAYALMDMAYLLRPLGPRIRQKRDRYAMTLSRSKVQRWMAVAQYWFGAFIGKMLSVRKR